MARIDKELNTRRLLCPMPVIRTQDAVAELKPGDHLKVIATDPGVKNDIPAWCRINGHTVLSIEDVNDEIILYVEVGNS